MRQFWVLFLVWWPLWLNAADLNSEHLTQSMGWTPAAIKKQLAVEQQVLLRFQRISAQEHRQFHNTSVTSYQQSHDLMAYSTRIQQYWQQSAIGVDVALADLTQSIALIKSDMDALRLKLQASTAQLGAQQLALISSELQKMRDLLAVQLQRQIVLKRQQVVIEQHNRRLKRWMKGLEMQHQGIIEQNKIDKLADKIALLHQQQIELQAALAPDLSLSQPAGGRLQDQENQQYIEEQLVLNRLHLFSLQVRIRLETSLMRKVGVLYSSWATQASLQSFVLQIEKMHQLTLQRIAFINKSQQQSTKPSRRWAQLMREYQQVSSGLQMLQGELHHALDGNRQKIKTGLYYREKMPETTWVAWEGVFNKGLEIPGILLRYCAGMLAQTMASMALASTWAIVSFALIVLLVIVSAVLISSYLKRVVRFLGRRAHRFSQKLLWVCLRLFRKNIFTLSVLMVLTLFQMIFSVEFGPLIHVILIIIVTHAVIHVARILLMTDMSDVVTRNPRHYYRLRAFFLFLSVVTSLIVVARQLPIADVIVGFANKFFMFALMVMAVVLFRSWNTMPRLLEQIFSVKKRYILNVIRLFSHLIPVTLLINAVIGMVGYVSLAFFIGWIQMVALLVLLGYLVLRGLFNDIMSVCYTYMVKHVQNGWLWVQAFLKPIDTIVRIFLFIFSVWLLITILQLASNPAFIALVQRIYSEPLFMLGANKVSLQMMVRVSLIVAILVWVGRWSREFAFRVLYQNSQDIGLRNSLSVFTQYAVVFVGILVAMRILGIDLKGLAFVAAAFAAGVGFGLRDLLNNFFSGILLLAERPFRAGDSITLGQFEGEVISTGIRSMKIRTWDHMDVIVPNSDMFTKPFVNWTHQDSIVRTVVKIKLSRVDDPCAVQALIYDVLKTLPAIVDDPSPEVFLKEISDTLVEMEIRYFINLQQDRSRPRVRSEVLFAVYQCFKNNGIHAPLPQYSIIQEKTDD